MVGAETVLDDREGIDHEVDTLCERVGQSERALDDESGSPADLAAALADLAAALDVRGRLTEKTEVLDRLAGLHDEHPEQAVRRAYARAIAPCDKPMLLSRHVERGDEAYLVDLRDRLQSLYEEYQEPAVAAALGEVYVRADERECHSVVTDAVGLVRELHTDVRSAETAAVLSDIELGETETLEDRESYLDEVEQRYERFTEPVMAGRLMFMLAFLAEVRGNQDQTYAHERARKRVEELYEEYEDDPEVAAAYGYVKLWKVYMHHEWGVREQLRRALDELADLQTADPGTFSGSYAAALGMAVQEYGSTGDFEDVEAFLEELRGLFEDHGGYMPRQWYARSLVMAANDYRQAGRLDDQERCLDDLGGLHDDVPGKTVWQALADGLSDGTDVASVGSGDERPVDVGDPAVRERVASYRDRLSDLQDEYGDLTAYVARATANRVALHATAGEFDAADAAIDDLRASVDEHDSPPVRAAYARALGRDAESNADREDGDSTRVSDRRDTLVSLYEDHAEAGVATWLGVAVAAAVRDTPDAVDLDYETDRVRTLAEEHPDADDALGEAHAELAYRALEAEAESAGHDGQALETRLAELTEAHDMAATERAGWFAASGAAVYNRAMQEGPGEPYTDLSIKAASAEAAFEKHGSQRIAEQVFEAHRFDVLESLDQGDTLISFRTKLDSAEEFYEEGRAVDGVDAEAAFAEYLAAVGERVTDHDTDRADEIHQQLVELEARSDDAAIVDARRRVEEASANSALGVTEVIDESNKLLLLLGLAVTLVVVLTALGLAPW